MAYLSYIADQNRYDIDAAEVVAVDGVSYLSIPIEGGDTKQVTRDYVTEAIASCADDPTSRIAFWTAVADKMTALGM